MIKSKLKKCANKTCKNRSANEACSYECALIVVRLRNEKKKNKEWKEKKKVIKEKLKRVIDYKKEARYWFQRWIRIRDLGKDCISCDTILGAISKYDAGHYYSASGYPQLLFNEYNCNSQCVFCNQHKSGNLIEYRKGIIYRYGINVLFDLENLADDKTKRVITKEEFSEITEKYKKLVKDLEKE